MRLRRLIGILFGLWFFHSWAQAEVLGVYQTEGGTGWLERSKQGDLILHLEGTYYEMGYQQGKLLEKEIRIAIGAMKGALHHYLPIASYEILKPVFYQTIYLKEEPYIPEEIKEEMKGLADATGIPLKELQILHSAFYLISCSAVAVFGPASKDGELYQIRNLDYPLYFIDQKTKTPIQNLSLIVIYQPKGGIAFVNFAWPGFLGSVGGMNAEGICISENSLASKYEQPEGIPMIFRIKQTLGQAKDLEQAIELLTRAPRDGAYNLMVGDGKIPRAVAIEEDAKTFYVGSWDGPAEHTPYFYKGERYFDQPREGLLIRTNHALSTELSANSTVRILGKLAKLLGTFQRLGRRKDLPPPPDSWLRYQDWQRRLEEKYGAIGPEELMDIAQAHYQGLCAGAKDNQCVPTMYQAVYAPKTGDFLISFARGDPRNESIYYASAYNQNYSRYNLFELLKNKP